MYRNAHKYADAEKKERNHKAKYAEKKDLVDSDADDSDDSNVDGNFGDSEDAKPVHANANAIKKPTRHGCVKTQPLPARLVSALDEPLCYAQSVRYGKEVTLSGIWAYGRNGLLVADDDESLSVEGRARAQTKQAFRNVHDALVAAGCRGLEDLTSMVVSLVDQAATAAPFLQERAKIMGDHVEYTSSVVGITGFPVPGGLVHIDASAVVGRGCLLSRAEKDDLDDAKARSKHADLKNAHGGAGTSGCVVAYPKPAHLGAASGGKPRNAIAVRYGKEVTLAGIWAYTDRARLIRGGGDAREQARQTFKNVYAALIEAGCRGFEDVTSINASLVDVEETWPAFVEERDRALGANHGYTSSIVGITGFPVEGGLVHVDVKAVVGRGCLLGGAKNNAHA